VVSIALYDFEVVKKRWDLWDFEVAKKQWGYASLSSVSCKNHHEKVLQF